jgi:predicted TIM-barrel fold metal-dependent hydrolase
MGRIIDSEAHAWIRLPTSWRHKAFPGEPRSPMSARSAACYRPARPAADGSFPMPEDTSAELLDLMAQNGVDMSVIYPGACMCPNDEIARVIASAPDRFIGFAKYGQFLPPFENAKALQAACDEIEHGLRDHKLRGLAEISLEQWEPQPLDRAVADLHPMFELCKRYGNVPVVVHAHAGGGAKDTSYCHPAAFEPLMAAHPTVPLVLNHMGGARRDFFDTALGLAKRYDNVRFNTSQTLPEHLAEAVRSIGAERIFFGVDWYALDEPETPSRNQHRNQLQIVERASLGARDRELVLGESIARLLHLN